MSEKRPALSWGDLNTRQQTYLQAIYTTDQAQEQSERLRAAMDRRSRPADEWRWMLYADTLYGHTPLKQRLVDAGVVDPGTGSTFEALEKRGYILVKYDRATSHPLSDTLVYVRLTTPGRKLVRQALGLAAPKKAPLGELREWHWRALVEAWKAGDEGLRDEGRGYGRIGWNTWLRLRDFRAGGEEKPLAREQRVSLSFSAHAGGFFTYQQEVRMVITECGKAYYRENWQRYHEQYPAVDAPAPSDEA